MKQAASDRSHRKALAGAIASARLPATLQAAVGRVDSACGEVLGVGDAGQQRRVMACEKSGRRRERVDRRAMTKAFRQRKRGSKV